MFAVLILIIRKYNEHGLASFTYLGLYSMGRLMIEGLRTDSLMLGPFRVAQLVSLCGIAVWLVFLIIRVRHNKKAV